MSTHSITHQPIRIARCAAALAGGLMCVAGAASNDAQPIYLAGRVLAVDERRSMVAITLERSNAAPPAALSRFAIPKSTDSATQDHAVWVLGSAKAADSTVRTWQVHLAPRATLTAWAVPAFNVGDALAVVGYTPPTAGDSAATPTVQAHYLIGNGKVTPLRALPR